MKLQPFQKRTWANIDLDAAEHNYNIIREQLKPETKICCVVKANGYGHGSVQLSRFYESMKADYLAVSNIEEAIQLRNADVTIPILILGYTDPRCAAQLAYQRITQCGFSYDYGKTLSDNAVEQGVDVVIHLKIDSGMGRIGFQYVDSELDKAAEICYLSGLKVEGIFTHFASADEGEGGKEYTLCQFNRFMHSISYLEAKGISFTIRHCSNNAGIFDYPEMHLNMVRAGIVLYGLQPSNALHNPGNLRPVLTFKTIIDHIKTVHAGDCISYGREFKADREMKVATIPVGYADGLWRSNYRNHMVVEVEGKLAPIIGRVCMDQCMIDVTDIYDVAVNSKVTVYGTEGQTSVDHIASSNQTINYEIVCALGERVPRVYKRDGQTVAITDNIVRRN
ncbi:alanine racemase [uncultured Ruminococcus sp.]|uniref:alanine racemase n=1 Tax=uncultured Ruminococcus sp. TaxID=165186 RepID=UPI00261F6B87|nr:alanine racemase [uncultured Ruminococcus sp.]